MSGWLRPEAAAQKASAAHYREVPHDRHLPSFSIGAPLISQPIRGAPATIVAMTIPTATPDTVGDQTNQGATAATVKRNNSIKTLIGPGVGTTTLFLSFVVEKIDGSPTRSTRAGRTSHLEYIAMAHGPAIQAMSSDRNLSPEDINVSCGWLKFFSMIPPPPN